LFSHSSSYRNLKHLFNLLFYPLFIELQLP
jgi:hypothetical protein